MSKLIEGMVECPFYVKEGEKFICCEGLVGKSSAAVHRFKSDEDKVEYQINYCCVNNGKKCPHYRSLMLLYERGEKN